METLSKKRPNASAAASTSTIPPPPPKKGFAKPKPTPRSALSALQGKTAKGTWAKV